jgi:transcriptional regulator with XRE-family HTH domain
MITNSAASAPRPRSGRSRAGDVDYHVGRRIRECRIMRGLTQLQLAELIGVSYQQAHKYEVGLNRVAVGRLYQIAQGLGVEPSYFFEGLKPGTSSPSAPTDRQRAMLELARSFTHMPSRAYQAAICDVARALAAASLPLAAELDQESSAIVVR